MRKKADVSYTPGLRQGMHESMWRYWANIILSFLWRSHEIQEIVKPLISSPDASISISVVKFQIAGDEENENTRPQEGGHV
jgi:hypothetical protein